MAKVTIEFDTDIPEQYSNVVKIFTEVLGERPPIPFGATPSPIPSTGPQGGYRTELSAEETKGAFASTMPAPPSQDNAVPPLAELPYVLTGTPDPVDISRVNDPTTFTATHTPDLDSEGIPWDSRIHTDKRTKRQSDMTWKLRRNVPDATVQQVKNELQGAQAPVAVPPTTQSPVMPGQSEYQILMQAVSKAIPTGRLTMTDVETACTNAGLDTPQDLANQPDRIPQVAAELGIALC